MKLYNYFRSSASYRVRIALALKGLAYDYVPVHLLAQRAPRAGVRRADADAAGAAARRRRRAHQRSRWRSSSTSTRCIRSRRCCRPTRSAAPACARLALDIACEIHPLNNLRVLRYLVHELGVSEDAKNAWYRHWVEGGLEAVERQLAGHPATGRFCHGDTPTLADCTLVPQIFNARRVDCRLDHVPTVMRVFDECMQLPAFDEHAAEPLPRRDLTRAPRLAARPKACRRRSAR